MLLHECKVDVVLTSSLCLLSLCRLLHNVKEESQIPPEENSSQFRCISQLCKLGRIKIGIFSHYVSTLLVDPSCTFTPLSNFWPLHMNLSSWPISTSLSYTHGIMSWEQSHFLGEDPLASLHLISSSKIRLALPLLCFTLTACLVDAN